jgi:hypothetical protein
MYGIQNNYGSNKNNNIENVLGGKKKRVKLLKLSQNLS